MLCHKQGHDKSRTTLNRIETRFKMSERGIRVVSLFKKLKSFFTIPSVPKLDETWWGPANTNTEDETIRPFKVNVPEEVSKYF